MALSIRKNTYADGRHPTLFAYRKFDRSNPIASAFETRSGFWIVSARGLPMDVAPDEKTAREMLQIHRHVGVGRCPVCGHYGADCTGIGGKQEG
jgi:hypothetical protein